MKKESAAWNIAATHFLTAGFVIPLLTTVIIGAIFSAIGMNDGSTQTLMLSNMILLVSIWFGVMYSAGYLAKKYIIPDAKKVINLSTIYKVILTILFSWLSFSMTSGDMTAIGFAIGFPLIGVVVFYVASKKYVKQDSTSGVSDGQI